MADAVLSVELQAQINQYTRNMREAANVTQQTGGKIDNVANKIAGSIGAAFSVAAIVGFGKAVLEATAQYQKFQAVLGNTLGSSALANLKLKELQDFAAKTPFGVNELTGAFVKLANSGFKPTGDEMRKLGDLASSTGKSFDQLAEAIIDAQTGEFERLKEFGVRAKDAGDSVIFTYKGVQTQVEKTSESIRNYITSLGDAEGTSGAMAKISETLGGQISNLGDSWDQMLISVGGNTEGVFNSAISVISKAINKVTEFNKQLQTANKSKLSGADLVGGRINRMFNPFAKAFNNTERAVGNIEATEDALSKFVAKTISGAKNVNDFGKALADLQKGANAKKANFEFIPNSLLDGRDISEVKSEYKKEANAIQQAYQNAINAVIDGRKNFAKEANKPSSNFGTTKGGKSEAEKIADVYQRLASELKSNPLQFGNSKIEIAIDDINSYQTALKALVGLGIDPTSKSIQNLIDKQENLAKKFRGGDLEAVALDTSKLLGLKNNTILAQPKLKIEPIVVGISELQKLAQDLNEQFSGLVENTITGGLTDVASSIGEAIASGGSVLSAVGDSLLGTFSNFLSKFGELLIEYGAAAILKGKLDLAAFVPGAGIAAGIAAVAAGVALVAASAAINGLGGSKQQAKGGGVTAFANGGIISGPTLGLMGEYAGAKSDPEVVAPLSKLKNLLGETDSSGNAIGGKSEPNIIFEHRVEIDGNKLVVLTDRVRKQRDRIK